MNTPIPPASIGRVDAVTYLFTMVTQIVKEVATSPSRNHENAFHILTPKLEMFVDSLPSDQLPCATKAFAQRVSRALPDFNLPTAIAFNHALGVLHDKITKLVPHEACRMPEITGARTSLSIRVSALKQREARPVHHQQSPADELGESSGYHRQGANKKRDFITHHGDDGEGEIFDDIDRREARANSMATDEYLHP